MAAPSRHGFPLDQTVALITGASSGLGAEFARQLAPQASLLLLTARNQEAMEKLEVELKQKNPDLQVVIVSCDLATEEGRGSFWKSVAALPVKPKLLVNNAGLGDYGLFANASDGRILRQIDLNITALTLLSRRFLDHIAPTAEDPAAILNVSSLASTLPIPDLAVYAATKAYVTSLSEALAIELAGQHVRVSAVCPGPTPTNFGTNARRPGERDIDRDGQDLLRIPPERVVAEGLHTLSQGHPLVFPGKRVSLAATIFRLLPRFLLRRLSNLRFQRSLRKSS